MFLLNIDNNHPICYTFSHVSFHPCFSSGEHTIVPKTRFKIQFIGPAGTLTLQGTRDPFYPKLTKNKQENIREKKM